MSGLLGSFEPTAVFVLGIATLIALVASIRLNRPALTWPWWAISAAMALFLAGGALRVDLHTLGNITRGRSLVPDLLSLPGYAPGAGGTAWLRGRATTGDKGTSGSSSTP